ncbi:MAG TPA: maleylpyruvate isomerase family mycothiol-dependent enzyme [Angustibacter sp.]|nr:maleylpyruvate isomerase family mycothiol-dependent enzyme [Angustibacter sp.]
MLTRERYLAALEQDVAVLAEHLASGDLATPVPSCPGWDLGDLCGHLGVTHRWATDALTSSTPPHEGAPPARGELAAWFRDGADRLLAALRGTDPATECWGFGPKPRTVGFWVRRQALETAVHLWDAATALGRPVSVPADLAADGVDEVARMFYPRQVRLGRREPLLAPVLLRCTDIGSDVLLGDGEPVAAVEAAAEPLLLLVWGRRDLASLVADGARVSGDETAVHAALAVPLTP